MNLRYIKYTNSFGVKINISYYHSYEFTLPCKFVLRKSHPIFFEGIDFGSNVLVQDIMSNQLWFLRKKFKNNPSGIIINKL